MKINQFYKIIYEFLINIPKGKVTTYGQIAKKFKLSNPRIVGRILHKNKHPEKYPCHRVIKSDGSIADGYAYGGKEEQIKKLKEEGVIFRKDKVNLKKCLYLAY